MIQAEGGEGGHGSCAFSAHRRTRWRCPLEQAAPGRGDSSSKGVSALRSPNQSRSELESSRRSRAGKTPPAFPSNQDCS